MGLFSKNKAITTEEYDNLSKKIVTLSATIEELQTKFQQLETKQNSLRGFVNKRYGDEEPESTKSQSLLGSVLLPDNGNNR